MTDHNPTRSSRSRKRKAAPKKEAPNTAFQERMNDFQFEVLEVEATPIVEPAPEPTPVPEPEKELAPKPKLAKPWEVVRPMPPTSPDTWQRGQKWRP